MIQLGVLRKQDPEVINGVLHTVMLLRLHKEDLGKDLFPQIMDVIIDYIAEGLTRPEEYSPGF
ncbi:Transcriptional regulator (fragment) [anaerobic digester metagenome]|uniref:Transcriptional regulator n=1 Tax=anaerobic digester metagenome TaxID=1263854 RepID=A0A485M276_9ZZZZ